MAAISLSDLLQEVGISERQLDTRVSDEHLIKMSVFLTSRERLTPSLGLNEADMEVIEAEGRGEEDKRLKMLQRWKTKNAFKATYRKLVDALLSLGMASHAEKVCRLVQPEATSSGSDADHEVKVKAPRRDNGTLESLQADLLSRMRECEALAKEGDSLRSKAEELETELSTKTQENDSLRRENETLQAELSSKTEENGTLSKKIETLQSERKQDSSEIYSLRAQIERLEREVQKLSVHQGGESSESPTGLSPHTKLQWRRGADAPEIWSAQAVVMGERVYVRSWNEVFQYDWRRDTWSTLPDCPVTHFEMAQFLGKLITVGGQDRRQFPSSATGKVYLFNAQQWEEFLPSMPTARYDLTVVTRTSSPKQAIVACGGRVAHDQRVNTVEVYSHASLWWHSAKPLPIPCCQMTSVTIDDTCYLLGGWDGNLFPTKRCFSVSLDSLIDSATSPHSQLDDPIWMSVSDTPLILSTAASLRGSLIAVGGVVDTSIRTTSALHVLTSDGWERVRGGDLPELCRESTAVCLPSGELLVAGGWDHWQGSERKKTVFIAYILD